MIHADFQKAFISLAIPEAMPRRSMFFPALGSVLSFTLVPSSRIRHPKPNWCIFPPAYPGGLNHESLDAA
jgi:hypothetical protein